LKEIALTEDVQIVFTVHLNPNVSSVVLKALSNIDRVFLIDPVDYLTFTYLMNRSYLILTDSGGIQEEAPSLGKPVLVMRNTTERQEVIASGAAILVGTKKDLIVHSVRKLINDKVMYKKMSESVNPYGDGRASERIVKILEKYNEN
jgi:UDP-N-acetylglucosamine 2-epimerase (non-hydrolysing)